MTQVRRAGPADLDELVRLRRVMITSFHGASSAASGAWLQTTADRLREWLAAPDHHAAAVVEKPDRPGELAACAVGTIERSLGHPANPSGLRGHILNVATDPAYRRRGYARACTEALLDWFDDAGVVVVDLFATTEAEALYRDLGFVVPTTIALRRLH